jgi:hypothetical protein
MRLAPVLAFLLAAPWHSLQAQNNGVLTIAAPERLSIKRGATGEVRLKAELRPGFHTNSNTPADEFLIPLKLTWSKEPLETEQITYPKPQLEKLEFSANPVSIFSGTFEILTRFKAPASLNPGPAMLNGKLRYQACKNKECLPPRTVDVRVTLDIQ